MKRLLLMFAVLALVISAAASCSKDDLRGPEPTCEFDVGDTVTRGTIGAAVPPRGETVSGHSDGASSSSEITIDTSDEGVVTITGSRAGEPIPSETCVLP